MAGTGRSDPSTIPPASSGAAGTNYAELGGDSDFELDVLDGIKAGRLANNVHKKTDPNNSDDNDSQASHAERERDSVPDVTLAKLKWANVSVPKHLRRARLLFYLNERLQADADERAVQGDPLDEVFVQVRAAKYKELFGAAYATSIHLFRRVCARATVSECMTSTGWDHDKVCMYAMKAVATLILNGDMRQIIKIFGVAADQ